MVGKSVTLAFTAAALASSAEASPFGWRPPFWYPPEPQSTHPGSGPGFWPGWPGFGWGPTTSSAVHSSTSFHTTSSSLTKTSTSVATSSSSSTHTSTTSTTPTSTVKSSASSSGISATSITSATSKSSSSTVVVGSSSISTSVSISSSSKVSSTASASTSSKASSSGVSTSASSKAAASSSSSLSVVSSGPASSSLPKQSITLSSTSVGSGSTKSACSRRTKKSSVSGSASASKSPLSSSVGGSASASGSVSGTKSTPSASASASKVSSANVSASVSLSISKQSVSKSGASTGTKSKTSRVCTRRSSKTGLSSGAAPSKTPVSSKTAGTSTRACSRRTSKSTLPSASVSSVVPSRSASKSVVAGSSSASRTVASGSVTSSGILPSGTSSLSPCGSISKLLATSTKSAGQSYYTVPAQLGLACLNSIPFNSSAAVAYLDSIRPFLNWQSTIEYLKSPPAEYAAKVQPAYDFLGNFERIYSNAVSDSYASEYAFGFDVYKAFQTAHDGHFVVYPDSVAELITFGRTTPLVSVSTDGSSIPQIYLYTDILASRFGNASFTPSAITEINGEDSTDFLLNFSQVGSLQDRDALWNNVFYEPAQVALGSSGTGTGTFTGSGRGRFSYPGPITTLTFANGTTLTNNNFARILVPFTNITSGADLYKKYLIPPAGEPQGALLQATSTSTAATTPTTLASSTIASSRPAASTTVSTAATTIPAPGYPSPYIREKNNLNSGYFLGAGYDDVAVLAVNSFVGTEADELDFQAVNTYLINQAVKFNKTKLIVDVSANGGGTILQGYDLFKQLFPTIQPYGAQRFRAHEAVNLIGQEFSAYAERVPRSLDTNDTTQGVVADTLNYMTDLDVNLKPFTSWAEKYGPFEYGPQPDNFSSLFRWNLSDVLTPDNSGGIYVSGYLNRSNITTQPFKADNIVVVTDGYCASTCTIFSELMRQQGGVKYVALGGRPNKDITQAVGGVKGTNDLLYADILGDVEQVFSDPLLNTRQYYNTTVLGQYSDLAIVRSSATVVNFRDGLRQGDTSQTPLQFVYEPADCRIYYTPEMTVDIAASWRAVADSAWNGINHCVAGSLGGVASVSRRAVRQPRVHSEHEKRMIYESVANVYAGQGNIKHGDSVMII